MADAGSAIASSTHPRGLLLKMVNVTSWSFYGLLGFLLALWLIWLLLARIDFAYGLWYRVLDIDKTIQEYGPQNRLRRNFERTTFAERKRLFGEIVTSIHNGGEGLRDVAYFDPQGAQLGRLLRYREIQHLQDVSDLLTEGRRAGWSVLALWLFATMVILLRKLPSPSLGKQLAVLGGLLALATVGLWIKGPVDVFYAWHEWVFPPDHQWFFHYKNSLMSTMMKAPDLFGGIAVLWVSLAFGLWTLWVAVLNRIKRRLRI